MEQQWLEVYLRIAAAKAAGTTFAQIDNALDALERLYLLLEPPSAREARRGDE